MKYFSTRNKNLQLSSAEAILKGLSDDGGLFCPHSIPKITEKELLDLVNASYIEKTVFVFSKFLTDFTNEELTDFALKAYTNKFENNIPAPVVKTEDNTYVLELFRGPTCAFKDMALQMLPHLMTGSLNKLGETKTACILVATSGDTGKAALEGFKDTKQTKILVFYPENGVSDVQKLQMATQKGANVSVCAIKGNFDDAQSAVKLVFADEKTANTLNENDMFLSSANSINWGRLVPQIIYYISAYTDLVKSGEIKMNEPINICVPTGNFGNILAGYYAKKMGININKLIIASNENNVLTDFIKNEGEYNKNREFHLTNSPSMDILISSNLERLLFLASNYDDKFVLDMMTKLNKDGKYKIPENVFENIKNDFNAYFADDKSTEKTINEYYEKTGYLLDTHTAVSMKAYEDYKNETKDNTKTVVVSTASPYKFADSVLLALGNKPCNSGIENLKTLEQKTGINMPKSLKELENLDIRFKKVIEKDKILDEVSTLINM